MPPKHLTVPAFSALKAAGRKICMVTAYDYTQGRMVDAAGVDAILVGDSVAMVSGGHDTTLPITLDQMIYHAEMVCRGVSQALVVVDMPFPTHLLGRHKAVENAARILKESRCQAVKLEGGAAQADTIAALVNAGIPVMAHVGLRPQSVHQLGGYRFQRDTEILLNDAQAAADAGAFGIVLECIPAAVAKQVTAQLEIPTIGIGAGPHCDGQVLVLHDLLGMSDGFSPRFSRRYAQLHEHSIQALKQFSHDVRSGEFPDATETLA